MKNQDSEVSTPAPAPSEPTNLCPSCRAADNYPYQDASGTEMRACGRCMIQWRTKAESPAPAPEQPLSLNRKMNEPPTPFKDRIHMNNEADRLHAEYQDELLSERGKELMGDAPTPPKCAICSGPHTTDSHGTDSQGVHPWNRTRPPKEMETRAFPSEAGRAESTDKRRYCPDPRTTYSCVYCNKPARLVDADVVVDSYQNVVHVKCWDEEVAPNVRRS